MYMIVKIKEWFHHQLIYLNSQHSYGKGNLPQVLGMISKGEDNLLLSCGARLTLHTRQSHTQYDPDPDPNFPNHSYTNEIHLMSLTSSPGIM